MNQAERGTILESPLNRAVMRMAQRMMDMEMQDRRTSFPADLQGMAHTLLTVALEELELTAAPVGGSQRTTRRTP